MKGYVFDYINENEFKKLERALKKYNMLAYKKLNFEYYPSLRNGEFVGELTSQNRKAGTETYELILPSDSMFSEVHGDVKLIYTVYINEQTIMLNTISPTDVLLEGEKSELTTYKGIMISKKNATKDMFKIDLLMQLQGNDRNYSTRSSYSYKKPAKKKQKQKSPKETKDVFITPDDNLVQPNIETSMIQEVLKWYMQTNDYAINKKNYCNIDIGEFAKLIKKSKDMFVSKDYIANNIMYNIPKPAVTNLLEHLAKDKILNCRTINKKKYYQSNNKNILLLNQLIKPLDKEEQDSSIELTSNTNFKPIPLLEYMKALSTTQFNMLSLNNRKKDLHSNLKNILNTNLKDVLKDKKQEYEKLEKFRKERNLIAKKLEAMQDPSTLIYNIKKPQQPTFNLDKPPMPKLTVITWANKFWAEEENQRLVNQYNAQAEHYNKQLNIYIEKLAKYNEDLEEYNKKIKELKENDEKKYDAQRTKYASEISKLDKQIRKILKENETDSKDTAKDIIDKQRKNSTYYNKCKLIAEEIEYIEQEIEANRKLRDNLYSFGIIYPKYQTLSATASFLEYLECGRCTELAGATGGYNLYEQEIDSKSQNKHYYLKAKIQEINLRLGIIENEILFNYKNVSNKIDLSSSKTNLYDEQIFNIKISEYYKRIKDEYNKALEIFDNAQK